MNEWLKKMGERIKALWGKWNLVQKLIFFGIIAAVIVAIVIIFAVNAAPSVSKVISKAITDETELERITNRLEKEGLRYEAKDGFILVKDEKTARKARAILVNEDLLPKDLSAWDFFKTDRWTLTDFERKQNLRQSIIQLVESHIEALDDVDDANITITMPEKELFQADQKEVSASIIISPSPGSDLTTNRKKLEGIQRLVKLSVEGLKDENIVITDQNGIVINDFAGLADMDRLDLTKREQKFIRDQEAYYRAMALQSLRSIFTAERVRDLNIKIHMDMSKKEVQSRELLPFVEKADNPRTPYDDSVIKEAVPVSSSKTTYEYQGTGFNPEGPAGVEGQTAPAYRDMQNMNGRATQTQTIVNNEIGERKTQETVSPRIDRVTASVNIDGTWQRKYDAKGKVVILPNGRIDREYAPVSDADVKEAERLLRGAFGYDIVRGDTVAVTNIAVDRSAQFAEEDAAFIKNRQIQDTVIYSLIGLAALMVIFIVARLISREVERRKRLKEEELARRHQMMRESALRQAEEEGVEVSMSVEERKRLEMQESAINMAKDHPEDVAQLIRTWLMEE
jgi:flagellar M-ring protein FliF